MLSVFKPCKSKKPKFLSQYDVFWNGQKVLNQNFDGDICDCWVHGLGGVSSKCHLLEFIYFASQLIG